MYMTVLNMFQNLKGSTILSCTIIDRNIYYNIIYPTHKKKDTTKELLDVYSKLLFHRKISSCFIVYSMTYHHENCLLRLNNSSSVG